MLSTNSYWEWLNGLKRLTNAFQRMLHLQNHINHHYDRVNIGISGWVRKKIIHLFGSCWLSKVSPSTHSIRRRKKLHRLLIFLDFGNSRTFNLQTWPTTNWWGLLKCWRKMYCKIPSFTSIVVTNIKPLGFEKIWDAPNLLQLWKLRPIFRGNNFSR